MSRDLVTRYDEIEPFITKDGSIIRELMHPQSHSVTRQSFAEAEVPPGKETVLHRHHQSEELYHIVQGEGLMTLVLTSTDPGNEDNQFAVEAGDSICIPPGTPHKIQNTGDTPLKILCACSPAYSHDDTELLGD